MSYGFLTCKFREEYLEFMAIDETEEILTLNYTENSSSKLYFWQLYSILGEENINSIIKTFYEHIFNDQEHSYFSDTFKNLGSLDHHIKGQCDFWLDIMGGGKRYAGGKYRLQRHHDFAKQIMNENGAKRWIINMKNSLNSNDLIFGIDHRIYPCILDFLNFFMKKYSQEYNFHVSKL
jgi:truncated hemoglobin YjbI